MAKFRYYHHVKRSSQAKSWLQSVPTFPIHVCSQCRYNCIVWSASFIRREIKILAGIRCNSFFKLKSIIEKQYFLENIECFLTVRCDISSDNLSEIHTHTRARIQAFRRHFPEIEGCYLPTCDETQIPTLPFTPVTRLTIPQTRFHSIFLHLFSPSQLRTTPSCHTFNLKL